MNILNIPLLSRKFLFAVLLAVLGFGLVLAHQVTAKDWFSFVQVIGSIYVIGNVINNIGDNLTTLPEEPQAKIAAKPKEPLG